MTDAPSPLVRPEAPGAAPPPRRPWLFVTLGAVILILIAGIAGWWLTFGRATAPDWTRVAQLDLTAPAGDAFAAETPWVRLRLAPLIPGQENTLQVSLEAPRGTPVPGDGSARIASLTAQPLTGGAAGAVALSLTPAAGGALAGTSALDRAGWWRLTAEVEGEGDGATAPAAFYLLLPDPNINGPGAVPREDSTAEGEALFQRGLAATAGLQTVRYTQWMADGNGNAAISEHAVRAGTDGEPAGFVYRAAGGMEAVVIGSTRWIHLPGTTGWQRQEGAMVVPPAEWGEEYLGATGFSILGEETVDGERTQIFAFVVPEVTEPRSQAMAWYLWWVGTETGHVRREAMVSRQHYMLNHFTDFDAPLELTPPPTEATTVAATPVP
jgi:hypothetical protein